MVELMALYDEEIDYWTDLAVLLTPRNPLVIDEIVGAPNLALSFCPI